MTEGIVISAVSDRNNNGGDRVQLTSDGLVIGGIRREYGQEYIVTAKYKLDGTLQEDYGIDGVSKISFGYSSVLADNLIIQNDGKLIVTGAATGQDGYYDAAMTRINQDGSIDTTFGDKGKIIYDYKNIYGPGPDNWYFSDVKVQSDGKILVIVSSGAVQLIARFLSDGTPDQSFGASGIVKLQYGGFITDFTVDINGAIFATGRTYSLREAFAAKYLPNGNLDLTFADKGYYTSESHPIGTELKQIIYKNGELYVCGTAGQGLGRDLLIAKYSAPDESGNLKLKYINILDIGVGEVCGALAIQSDGKIIVGGNVGIFDNPNSSTNYYVVIRYSQDGSLDKSFGNGGFVKVDRFPSYYPVYDLDLLDNGDLVAQGGASDPNGLPLFKIRSDGSIDQTFGRSYPKVMVSSDKTQLKIGDTSIITFILNKSSTDFTASDVTAAGGSLASFSGSGTTYVASFTAGLDAPSGASLYVGSDKFSDALGLFNDDGADPNNKVTFSIATPTYSLKPPGTSVNEGSNATFSLITTNIAPGFSIPYTVSGVSAADITGGSLTGTATIDATGKATITIPVAADKRTEGDETLTVTAQGQTASVTIEDTSVNDAPVVALPLPDQNTLAGSAFAYTFPGNAFTDVDNAVLTYSAALSTGAPLPTWLSFSPATRTFSGTPGISNVGTIDVKVIASDSSLAVSDVFSITVNDRPVATSYSPADGAKAVAVGSNLLVTFNGTVQRGTGPITLMTADGKVVETFTDTNATVTGSTLTLNPTADLSIFTKYVVELGAGAVKDDAGNGNAADSRYDFQTATQDSLYHFFVVAFAAAPGATYMSQLAEAVNFGLPLDQIVEIFTTKKQFTDVYPTAMSNRELATQLVNNIVKSSASVTTKQSAIDDIDAALGIGWSRGKMLYTVFGNLASKPLTDPTWGNTAKQFQNQLAVARYFTEEMGVATENLVTLRGVIGSVTPDTDVSTVDKIVQIIGTIPPGG